MTRNNNYNNNDNNNITFYVISKFKTNIIFSYFLINILWNDTIFGIGTWKSTR